MFSVTLNGLQANTTYYYQVTARNSIGTNSSNLKEFTTPLPVLTIAVNSSGNSAAGEAFTLRCLITRAENVTGNVIVQWIGPDGSPLVSRNSIVVGAPLLSGSTISLSLQFTSLFTSHGGEYTCQANLMSQDTMYSISAMEDVIVRVPAPNVNLTGIPSSSLFAGTSILLTCTFELHSATDSQVTFNSVWRRGGQILNSNGRVNISTSRMTSPLTYSTTLNISPLSNTIDGGQYSCQSAIPSESYILFTDASQQATVRIEELPLPVITISSLGRSVAGENHTLSCEVSVIDGLVDDALVTTSWTDGRGTSLQADSVQTNNENTTLTLEFTPLLSSHGGQYICTASVTIPAFSVVRRNSESNYITIQIPQPDTQLGVVQQEPYLAGMLAGLLCSITLDNAVDTQTGIAVTWQRNGEELNDTLRVRALTPRLAGGSNYNALLQFSTLSSTEDSGDYTCISTIFPTSNTNFITNRTETASFTFSITDPPLTVAVSPSTYTGKDIAPSNEFTLSCTATKPSVVIPDLQLSWYHDGNELDSTVSGVTILDEVRNSTERFSTLSITSARIMNSGTYTCKATISIAESQEVFTNQTATVTITGPTAPNVPVIQRHYPSSRQALIAWIVGDISYTTETYQVEFGMSRDALTMRSEVVGGSSNLSSTNLMYSINITSLQPFRQYYYRVVARNSFATSQTSVQMLRTSEAAPTAPPDSFMIVSFGGRNVTLSWDLPEANERNGIIVGYSVVCTDIDGTLTNTITTSDLITTIEGLTPYSFYTCSVAASTSVGSGPAGTLNLTTDTEAPDDAPANVRVRGISPSSVQVSWIPPSTPNGIITSYNLYVNYSDGSAVSVIRSNNTYTNYTISSLQPYQLVSVSISSSTAAGEGPTSELVAARTREQDIPPPSTSTFEAGDSVAGQTFSLLCRVILPDGLTTAPQIEWFSPQGSVLTSEGELTVGNQQAIGSPSRLSTYMAQFSPLLSSHGGTYTCQATVSSPYGTIQESVSALHNLSVQIPQPMVSITSPTTNVYAGSFMSLNCTTQLNSAVDIPVVVTVIWRQNSNTLISSARKMVSDVTSLSNSSLYVADLSFNPVVLSTDDGAYMCEITVDTANEFVSSTQATSEVLSLRAQVPTLTVVMQPETGRVLDVPPLNTFTLRCVANAPDSVLLQKSFEWRNGGNIISDDGNTILISHQDSSLPQSVSELTVNSLTIGSHTYFCSVSMSVPGGVDLVAHASGVITVNGPSLPTRPHAVQAVNVTAYSVTVQWVIPQLAYMQEQYNVTYGTNRELLDQSSVVTSASTESNVAYALFIQDLTPNTEYYFQLLSTNTQGTTVTTIMTFTTLEAGPSAPPTNFLVIATSPFSINVSWSPPPLEAQNGIITAYILTCQPEENVEALPATYPVAGNYLINGFTPASTYNCSVYATTAGGSGPPATQDITLLDDVPGPVVGLTLTSISATVLQISWRAPEETNGEIQSYFVLLETSTATIFQESVVREQRIALVSNLNKHIPYNVSIKASTSAGYGPLVSNITFTEEGAPNTAPKQVSVVRLNTTHMNISWVKLTLEEARGLITGYTVTYTAVESRRKRRATMEVVGTDSSYTVISGLGYTQSYLVSISASTSAGEGISSTPIAVHAPPYSIFQLRITGIIDCNQWRSIDTLGKLQSTSQQIALVLSQSCQCTISAAYITSALFSCDPEETTHVIYRARLSSTPDVSNTELIGFMQDWVTSGSASVIIDHIQLTLEPSCNVVINSLSDPICPLPITTTELSNTATSVPEESGSRLTIIIIAILCVVAFLLIALFVFGCAFIMYSRLFKKDRKYTPSRPSIPSPRQEFHEQSGVPDHYEELPMALHSPPKTSEAEEKAKNLPTAAELNSYESVDTKPSEENLESMEESGDGKIDLTSL